MSAVVVNEKDFADPNFDPKKWINTVLKVNSINTSDDAKATEEDEESTDMTMLTTRLQLMSESTSQEFDRLSTQVVKSMPHVLYDLKMLSDNAKLVQNRIEEVRNNLSLVEDDTKIALEKLNRSHTVKTHMEECRIILLEESNHLEKLKEEERKRQQEEAERKAIEEAAAAAVAAKAKALEEENEKKRQIEAEKEEEMRRRRKEEQEKEEKEKDEREAARAPSPEIDGDALEYGHVQLPPLRQPPPRQHTFQQIQKQTATSSDHNDGYLQQISGSVSPQVSSVFKKIGVPLDKLWQ